MTDPWAGFWQIVDDDREETIVGYPPLHTTLSLRASRFLLYASGHFIEIRTEKGRHPPQGWPATAEEKVHYFRTSIVRGGRCTWSSSEKGWNADHRVSTCADPRLKDSHFRYAVVIEGDTALAEKIWDNNTSTRETWRRLSGPGTSPLAGAWESTGLRDRWLFLVTAGHYAVAREDLKRPAVPRDRDLTDHEILALSDGFGANAGAILVSAASFDNWPMVASNLAGFEARKHETFRLMTVDANRLVLSLTADGSDATEWTRLG